MIYEHQNAPETCSAGSGSAALGFEKSAQAGHDSDGAVTAIAECPFCRAQLFLSLTNANPTQAELSEEAAQMCTCPEARLDRGVKATENAIQKTLSEESLKAGFAYAANKETTDGVRAICQLMLQDFILGG